MPKFVISADSVEELQAAFDELFGSDEVGESKPKRTRRTKAQIAADNATAAPTSTGAPVPTPYPTVVTAPSPAAVPSPFGAPAPVASEWPGRVAAHLHSMTTAGGGQHAPEQVYGWAAQQLSMPQGSGPQDVVARVQAADDVTLQQLYAAAGGK